MTLTTRWAVGCSCALLMCGQVMAQGIYTCVDGKGRKITSDRPIAECMDRAQKEISPSGTVKRVLAPPPTAQEKAALEEKEKVEADARLRAAEEKLNDRNLLRRYPHRDRHDKDRATALDKINEAIAAASKRTEDLAALRKGIVTELDFYKSTPGKVPPALKRRMDETDSSLATHRRQLAEREAEKATITQRFDAEAAKLKPQWEVAGPSSAAVATGSVKKP